MKLGWYSQLTSQQKKTYWACYGGMTLDSMDSTIFSLALPSLIAALSMSHSDAGIMSSAGLIGSAVGGWGAGMLADRLGRVRVLQITILWVSLFTLLSAFITSFPELLTVRTLQGIGYGGEAAIGGVLISEAISSNLRGRVAASIQSAYAVGYGISVSIMPLIYLMFDHEIAWRVFFAVGILPSFLVIYIRRAVQETEVFKISKSTKTNVSLLEIFKPDYIFSTATATLLAIGVLGGAYVMITWLPTYLRTSLGLPIASTSGFLFINILGSFTGPLLCGTIIDRLGRRKTIITLLTCQAINVGVYTLTPINSITTFFLGYFLGAFQAAIASSLMPTFAELFPTKVRATGVGFCISMGRGFGSFVPALTGVVSGHINLGTAMGICAISSYIVGISATFILREASGSDLSEEHKVSETSADLHSIQHTLVINPGARE